MVRVFISSPYTIGDVAANVKFQIDVADNLMDKGFAPFVPELSHFQHLVHQRPYQDWIKIDLEWIKVCDCLLRLGGESKGADSEVAFAEELGIPVFYSIGDLYDSVFDDKIDEWHNSDTELSLPEYLGLTKEQYKTWVERHCDNDNDTSFKNTI